MAWGGVYKAPVGDTDELSSVYSEAADYDINPQEGTEQQLRERIAQLEAALPASTVVEAPAVEEF